jgi:tellurite resistance protein
MTSRQIRRDTRQRSGMPSQSRFPVVPASFFGIVLGLTGLGGDWRIAHRIWNVPAAIGETLMLLATIVWLILLVLYVAKWIFMQPIAKKELQDPIQCCFVGLVGVSAMLIAGVAIRYYRTIAEVLWVAGMLYTLAFAAWRTGGLWQGGREVEDTTAVLYLPAVAGSFVTAIVASALGYRDWGELAFGAGLFSWLAVESVFIHRLYTAVALPPPLRPTLGLQLAPPSVAALAYLSVNNGAPGLVAHALIGYAFLQALVLIRLMPWMKEQPFSAAYWAFTFGITALVAASLRLVERDDSGPVALLAPYLFAAVNLVMLGIIAGTLRLLARDG